jgi:aminomethyltransferase|tara:strand:+ start:409 stop:1584 length:1176 start_codon:yes stop_codon:yes gene_type:complete
VDDDPPATGHKGAPPFSESQMTDQEVQDLKQTPLDTLHREWDAKMAPFAGYDMAVQYPDGIIAEHLHTRTRASIFDVSHMGQAKLLGDDAAAALETLVPGDIRGLSPGRTRYTVLTNERGGILDDLMVTDRGDHLYLVVNAARKDADFAHIRNRVADRARLEILDGRALLAVQGPAAATVMGRLHAQAPDLGFMTAAALDLDAIPCFVTRSGYTGEDGYEISVAATEAEKLARRLLAEPEVLPAGLGARDSLRLEAGLCLYGHDIDETTTPVEASLSWVLGKRRRREGGFPGHRIILDQLKTGAARKRVGLKPGGKAPARAHTAVENAAGEVIGEVTSGGYGPSVEGPIAMGYVKTEYASPETPVNLRVRGKALPGSVVKLPFVERRYYKS